MDSGSQWVILAQILRPQGRRGELLAELCTDFPQRFAENRQVWLAAPEVDGKPVDERKPAEVLSHWLPVGRNAGRIVLQLAGVDSIEKAELLAGKEVVVPITERVPLDSDAAYISDLVGCTVFDHDTPLGVVQNVEFPSTPDGTRRLEEAAPLLNILASDGEEVLIPYVKAFLVHLDFGGRCIRMNLPTGLADINRSLSTQQEGE